MKPGPEALARMVKALGVVLPAPSAAAAKRDKAAKPKAAKAKKAAPRPQLNGSGRQVVANGAASG